MTDTLRCASCARHLPPESFRNDSRCIKRGSRAYSCLDCESGEQLSFAARRVERKATSTRPRSLDDLTVGKYLRRGDVLYVVTRADRSSGLVWCQQVSPPRPLSGELAIGASTLGDVELLNYDTSRKGANE